jgi:hypothetical protein
MKTKWLQTLVLLVLGVWPTMGWSQSEFDDDIKAFHARFQGLLLDKQRDQLETIAQELRRDRPRFASGVPQLPEFYEGLSDLPRDKNGRLSRQRAVERLAHLRAWHLAKPTATTQIALANALLGTAWASRGEGFADTISPAAEREMAGALGEAEKLLEDAERALFDAPAKDSFLYFVWVQVGILQGYERDRMRELVNRSLDIDPHFFQTVQAYCQYLLPKWHGDEGDLLPLAEELSEQMRERSGEAVYAIVAMSALDSGQIEGFSDDGFAWPRVRQGLRDWVKPATDSPGRWSFVAKFAHLAGDRELAAEAVGQLNGRWSTRVFSRRVDFLRTERWAVASPTDDQNSILLEYGIRPILDVAYVWEGQGVVPGVPDLKLEVRSVKDGSLQNEYQLESGGVELLAADETGQYVVFTSPRYRDTQVTLLDLDSRQETILGTQPGRTRSLCMSPDHRFVFAGNDQGEIKRWENAETPLPVDWDLGKHNQVLGLALTPDQSLLISIAKRQARVWEHATRTGVRAWEVHSSAAFAIACSPDGKTVASAGLGNEVKLWRIEDCAEVGTLVGGNTSLHSLAFSPDGKRLVGGTMSNDQPQIPGEVIVWDVESKQPFPPLVGHRLGIWNVKISPDGSQIASASEDGTVRLWPMPK